jgi:hypothetical protein
LNSPGHWSLLDWSEQTRDLARRFTGRNAVPNLHLARRLFKLINITDFKLISISNHHDNNDVVNCGAFVILNGNWLINKHCHRRRLCISTMQLRWLALARSSSILHQIGPYEQRKNLYYCRESKLNLYCDCHKIEETEDNQFGLV